MGLLWVRCGVVWRGVAWKVACGDSGVRCCTGVLYSAASHPNTSTKGTDRHPSRHLSRALLAPAGSKPGAIPAHAWTVRTVCVCGGCGAWQDSCRAGLLSGG